MKKAFIIKAIQIDPSNTNKYREFDPDPGVVLTEEEAKFLCEHLSGKFVKYYYRETTIGHYTKEYMRYHSKK